MEQAEKLAADLEKLRKNKERIPLDVLKTRYKTAYEELTENIKAEAVAILKPIVTQPPEWLKDCRYKAEYIEEIAEAFKRLYAESDYAKKIGAALYKRYSFQEAQQIAREINRKYQQELTRIFHEKTCLYTTAENWDPDNPVPPRIYNDLVDKFWKEETGEWITEDKPEGPALLIFLKGDKPKEE